MTKLVDITNIIRSKNSGPYELTMDIMFKTLQDYENVCSSKIINEKLICELYKINKEDIINIIEFKPANAIKITIKRPIASGDIGQTVIDLDNIDESMYGDDVIFYGERGPNLSEVCCIAKTNKNEILTRVSKRVIKVYINKEGTIKVVDELN